MIAQASGRGQQDNQGFTLIIMALWRAAEGDTPSCYWVPTDPAKNVDSSREPCSLVARSELVWRPIYRKINSGLTVK